MGNLNTRQTANSLLGRSKLVYRVNLDIPQPLRSQKDLVGFGNPSLEVDGNATNNPQTNPSASGLEMSIERTATTNGTIANLVSVNVHNLPIPLPTEFVLIASFSDLELILLSPQGVADTFAASVAFTYGSLLAAVTVQVQNTTSRINFPGTSAQNSFTFTNQFYTQVVNPGSPHHFSIVMYIDRNAQSINGEGQVYAGDQLVNKKNFTVGNNLSVNTAIDKFRFGLASARGSLYRASLKMHDIEIWFPD